MRQKNLQWTGREQWKSLPWNKIKEKEQKLFNRPLEQHQIHHLPYGALEGGERERERQRRPEKIYGEIIAENFPKMKNKRVTQVQESQRSTQDKLKEEHNETQDNQIEKN